MRDTLLAFLASADWHPLEFTTILKAAAPTICGVAFVRWFTNSRDSSNAIVFVATG